MKKIWRRLSAAALGAATLAALVTVSAGAVGSSVVTVELRPNVEIVVDGVSRTFYNAQGKEVQHRPRRRPAGVRGRDPL